MNRIVWNEPRFDEEDIKEVTAALRENYVNEGPRTKELERQLGEFLGSKYVIMTANGTAALYLAFKATALLRGLDDYEVIVPDMTMIATATAVNWAGGTPILVDVDDRGTLDVDEAREKITARTAALAPVHILGRSCEMDGLEKLAQEKSLVLVEDAAGALGSRNQRGYLGTFGEVGCFSLQSNKIVTSGQGGFVTTEDDAYYDTMRRIRDFGRANNKEFYHMKEGYNLKFSDLAAALALSQFRRINDKKERLVYQRKAYEEELAGVKELVFPEVRYAEGEVPLWVDVLAERRNELSAWLKERGISPRNCWPAVHRNPPYSHAGTDLNFPVASRFADKGLWLPNGLAVDEKDIKRICKEVKEFYVHG